MGQYEDLIDALYALHSETDATRRATLLDTAVADDVELARRGDNASAECGDPPSRSGTQTVPGPKGAVTAG